MRSRQYDVNMQLLSNLLKDGLPGSFPVPFTIMANTITTTQNVLQDVLTHSTRCFYWTAFIKFLVGACESAQIYFILHPLNHIVLLSKNSKVEFTARGRLLHGSVFRSVHLSSAQQGKVQKYLSQECLECLSGEIGM